jgi:hypothetical protein
MHRAARLGNRRADGDAGFRPVDVTVVIDRGRRHQPPSDMIEIETIAAGDLHLALGFTAPLQLPERWRKRALVEWDTAADDYIMRYVFRQFRPMRHLEFGTWLGDGVLRCVEECDAGVWTINLLEGETKDDGQWAYGEMETEQFAGAGTWSQRETTHDAVWVRTDAYGLIGRKYLDAGWGKRVCQIYADSREWDTRAFPDGFFDTVFIDGGHTASVVESDTRNALRLVRAGGLVVWHDFCPREDVMQAQESTRDVVQYLTSHGSELRPHLSKLFWVEPSWLLFGIRAE